jgi:hypothetical protein
MNTLPIGQAASQQWGDSRGGDALGSIANSAPATPLTVGAVGFGPCREDEPSLRELYDQACQSIVRQESELSEANARIAVLEQEQTILKATIESLRDALCSYKCADKAAADGGWGNI